MSSKKIPLIVLTKLDTAQATSIVAAPPVIRLSDQSVDYICGRCGSALVHAEDVQIHDLIIQCTDCGTYNWAPP